jgi:hypothetical protein
MDKKNGKPRRVYRKSKPPFNLKHCTLHIYIENVENIYLRYIENCKGSKWV